MIRHLRCSNYSNHCVECTYQLSVVPQDTECKKAPLATFGWLLLIPWGNNYQLENFNTYADTPLLPKHSLVMWMTYPQQDQPHPVASLRQS